MTNRKPATRKLIAKIRQLKIANHALREDMYIQTEYLQEESSRLYKKLQDADYDRREAHRAAEEERYRQYEREDIVRKLESAKSRGDDYEETRLLRKLRQL